MQPKDGYTVREYATTIGKHHNTVRNMIKNGKLPSKLQPGKTGVEWRVFPDGLPEEPPPSLTPLDLDSMLNSEPSQNDTTTALITRQDVVELIEYRGEIRAMREELSHLRELLSAAPPSNGKHWQPWREMIERTGNFLLRAVKRRS